MKENNYRKKISPCIGVCELDLESDLCIGCLRTSKEITTWSQIDNKQAMQIMEETKNRTLFKKVLR